MTNLLRQNPECKPWPEKSFSEKVYSKKQAKLAVVAQTRADWIQEMRLSVAADAGSENKWWSEKQNLERLLLSIRTSRYPITAQRLRAKPAVHERTSWTAERAAAPDELTSSRWGTPEDGSEKPACHPQPAQIWEKTKKDRAKTNLTSPS